MRWPRSFWARLRSCRRRPFSRPAPSEAGPEPADVDVKPLAAGLDARDLLVRVSDHVAPSSGGVSLTTAKVIVSGGRGVGSKEGFASIEELAGLLGAAVGCSRAVTSAGWR